MKLALKIIGVILVVLIVIAVIAPSFISKDLIKNKVIQQVESATGKKLTIAGELNVRFFPMARITMSNASLSGFNKKDEKPLVSLKSIDIGLELLPLLSKEVVIKKMDLDEPVIYLHRNANGESNWTFANSAEKPSPEIKKPTKTKSAIGGFQLNNIKISNGNISYLDETTGKTWQLANADLSAKGDGPNSAVSIKGSGEWQKKEIKVSANIDTLQSFLNNNKSNIKFTAQSDLFDIDFDGVADKKEYSGKAKISASSIKELQQWLDPSSKPIINAPLEMNISSDIACTESHCDLKKTSIILGKIKAQGSMSLEDGPRRPSLAIDLSVEELDLNPFLPDTAKPQANNFGISEALAADSKGWSREAISFAGLNSLDATVNIKAASLLIKKIKIGNPTLRAKILNGRLSADILGAEIYQGKGNITFSVDAANSVIEKHMDLVGVNAQAFLSDAMNEDHLSGKANMQVDVITRGASEYEMVSNLQGKGELKFVDGAIKGINIADMIRNVQSAFKEVNTGAQKTDFAELGGTFNITNGIVRNNDLFIKAPLMRLSGAGQVDLPARTINYRLKPEIVQTAQGQGGKDKQGLGIPIIIEGTIDNPIYRPDLQSVVHDVINDPQKIKDTVKDIKDQFKGDNKKETLKNLKGLLKGI